MLWRGWRCWIRLSSTSQPAWSCRRTALDCILPRAATGTTRQMAAGQLGGRASTCIASPLYLDSHYNHHRWSSHRHSHTEQRHSWNASLGQDLDLDWDCLLKLEPRTYHALGQQSERNERASPLNLVGERSSGYSVSITCNLIFISKLLS